MRVLFVLVTALAYQDPELALKGVETTEHFAIRFRPGTRAAAAVDRIAFLAEREFAYITTALAVKPDGGLELHLYDDLAELVAVTRTRGNAGFSAGNKSHLPFDNDQTRFHEMVHIIAYRIPKSGSENRNLFFAEGLANALLEFIDGVHVHAVASFEMGRKSLPTLADMTGARDFYAWIEKHPDVKAYDIAGSFIRYLLDTHGAEKVKKYYTGTPPKDAFGVAEAELDKAWRAHLVKYKVRPEVEVLLKRRRGEAGKFAALELDPDKRLPKELLGKPEDWKVLKLEAIPVGVKGWKKNGELLEGTSATPEWNILPLGTDSYTNAAVRAKIRPDRSCVGVQLQLGATCQGMLTNAGTFVWKEGIAAAERGEHISGRREIDLVLERRGPNVTVWIEGFKIVEGEVTEEGGAVGIGVAMGTATFEKVRIRELK